MNVQSGISVRRAKGSDLSCIARVNAAVFLGHKSEEESAQEWAKCLFRAFPLYQYFVATGAGGGVAGYIGWQIHGGFLRAEPVVELEQIGVDPAYQGKGCGSALLKESMKEVISWVRARNNRIESHITFIVWVYALNFNALSVYAKDFTDGVTGMRVQYGSRAENMLRMRVPIVMPIRGDA